jgi:hypothetical protein
MATQEYAASIQGVSIRVTRLDAAGNLLNGAGDSYVTSAFMRVSFTPEYEEGDEITEKGANGVVCVSYKAPDVLKRITMELAICEPDSELSQLLSGGLLLRQDIDGVSKSIGWAAPGVGDDPAGNGVAIECWSHAIKDGKKSSVLPYFHWIFPFAKMRQSGDRVIENGMLATTFEGYGLGNPNFGSGLDGRWLFPVAAERAYAYARTSYAPQGLKGFYTWSDNSADQQIFFTKSGIQGATTITVDSITAVNTTATITLSASASSAEVATGDFIVVSNVGDPFNTTSNLLGGFSVLVPSKIGVIEPPIRKTCSASWIFSFVAYLAVTFERYTVLANLVICSLFSCSLELFSAGAAGVPTMRPLLAKAPVSTNSSLSEQLNGDNHSVLSSWIKIFSNSRLSPAAACFSKRSFSCTSFLQ